MTDPAQVISAEPTLVSTVSRLATIIGSPHYPSADSAALRRWAQGQPVPLAFYRLWLRHLDEELPPENQTEIWMTIAWAIATCGKDSYDPRRPLGQALAESKFSEGRLERLLSAPDDVRIELFMSAVRFLAAQGERFNWADAAGFLLTNDPGKRETVHRRIADAYYRHLEPTTKE